MWGMEPADVVWLLFRTLLAGLGFLSQTPWHSVSWGWPSLRVKQTARFDAIRRGSDGASTLWPAELSSAPWERGPQSLAETPPLEPFLSVSSYL